MKKIVLTAGAILLVAALLLVLKNGQKPNHGKYKKIGILQTASHPALDAACKGFQEELSNLLGQEVQYTVYNAQGVIPQLHSSAQRLHVDSDYDAFFAIATPAAQALHAVEKNRPVIIAAVTDPASVGLVYPNTNVCGVRDMIDVPGQIQMMTELVPQAKTVGLLYTAGETNSLALVSSMEKELGKRGYRVAHFAAGSEADMQALTESACRKVDVIMCPSDNTVASTISLISSIARTHKKPLIVSDNLLVQYGPLASRGVDYLESGRQAARMAYKALVEQTKPAQLGFVMGDSDMVVINQETLKLLNLSETKDLSEQLVVIKDAA